MTATRTRKPTLLQRLTTICSERGWQCGLVRVAASASQPNTAQTCARMNAVAVWRDGCVRHLGLIVDVKTWSDEQLIAKLCRS